MNGTGLGAVPGAAEGETCDLAAMVGRLEGVLEGLAAVCGPELVELNVELRRVGLEEILLVGMRVSDGVGEQAMREVEAVWEGELVVVNARLRERRVQGIAVGG